MAARSSGELKCSNPATTYGNLSLSLTADPPTVKFSSHGLYFTDTLALHQELESIMEKGTLEVIKEQIPSSLSKLLLEKKSMGTLKTSHQSIPIQSVKKTKSWMETVVFVFTSIWKNNIMFFIDVKTTYILIPIHHELRVYLCFKMNSTVFHCKAGMLQVFTSLYSSLCLGIC